MPTSPVRFAPPGWRLTDGRFRLAAYYVAFGPHGPRAPVNPPGTVPKVAIGVAALVAAAGLPRFLVLRPARVPFLSRPLPFPLPALRRRKIPLAPYAVQVALFCAVSLLNNRAFAHRVPMPVHIIFRSGGLVVSMLMGWAIAGKR